MFQTTVLLFEAQKNKVVIDCSHAISISCHLSPQGRSGSPRGVHDHNPSILHGGFSDSNTQTDTKKSRQLQIDMASLM